MASAGYMSHWPDAARLHRGTIIHFKYIIRISLAGHRSKICLLSFIYHFKCPHVHNNKLLNPSNKRNLLPSTSVSSSSSCDSISSILMSFSIPSSCPREDFFIKKRIFVKHPCCIFEVVVHIFNYLLIRDFGPLADYFSPAILPPHILGTSAIQSA